MKYPTKVMRPNSADIEYRNEALALIKKHLTPDTADRFLALASQMVGQILALQDQRKMTRDMALQIVMDNIELGNSGVINSLMQSKGKA